jgi:hypothetical protein
LADLLDIDLDRLAQLALSLAALSRDDAGRTDG